MPDFLVPRGVFCKKGPQNRVFQTFLRDPCPPRLFFQEILQKAHAIAKVLRYRNEFDTHLAEQPCLQELELVEVSQL